MRENLSKVRVTEKATFPRADWVQDFKNNFDDGRNRRLNDRANGVFAADLRRFASRLRAHRAEYSLSKHWVNHLSNKVSVEPANRENGNDWRYIEAAQIRHDVADRVKDRVGEAA